MDNFILEENPLEVEELIIPTPCNLYITENINMNEELLDRINKIKNIINEINNIYGMRCKYEINLSNKWGVVLFYKNNKTNKHLTKKLFELDGFYLFGYKEFEEPDVNLKTLKLDNHTEGILFYDI
jgi:hypothetical protein